MNYSWLKPKEIAVDLRAGMSKEEVVKKYRLQDVTFLNEALTWWTVNGYLSPSDYIPLKKETEEKPK